MTAAPTAPPRLQQLLYDETRLFPSVPAPRANSRAQIIPGVVWVSAHRGATRASRCRVDRSQPASGQRSTVAACTRRVFEICSLAHSKSEYKGRNLHHVGLYWKPGLLRRVFGSHKRHGHHPAHRDVQQTRIFSTLHKSPGNCYIHPTASY